MEWNRKLISDAADIDVGTYSTTIPPYKNVYYLRYKTRKSHWKLATNETRITCCELRQQHLAGIHWNAQLRIYFPIQFPPRLLGTSVVFTLNHIFMPQINDANEWEKSLESYLGSRKAWTGQARMRSATPIHVFL